ncbi:EF-hand domain-containing protein [Scytonema hofmannii FACHB-248]|uniref:EF-hand domain-containing protein n=1 Tax=Scytonema hofmannii FACHB-248 TaxID=1842502 RepID=A0ABR8GY23_9CYAN|nr:MULTISPECIES: EF-hand domain-containing protein [Nostocales]MBD2607921.1 EF-hand domain-containing protein [Scytonema hofmannii FACHB-248]
MLSQLLQKKHTKNFQVYDLDGSGFVEPIDLERCASNLAKLRNWQPDSSEFLDLQAKYSAIWTNFWQPADINGDGKVSLEEYLKVVENSINNFSNSTELQNAHTAKANVIFDILDANNNDQISKSEYNHFFVAIGLTEKDAETAFVHLDSNADGHISRDEYVQASKEFHISEDVNSSGNWLYGSYE